MVHNLDNAQQLSFDFDEDDNDSDNLEKFEKAEPVVSEAVMPVVSIDAATQEWVENCFYRLAHSKFRSSFRLSSADLDYALKKGPVTIHQHARQFLTQRLAAANPSNDGRQTPLARPSCIYRPTCYGNLLPRMHAQVVGSQARRPPYSRAN